MRNIRPCALGIPSAAARALTVSLLILIGALAAPRSQAVPLAIYGGLPSIEDVTISPDGARLAYVRTHGDQRFVVVANVADRKLIAAVKAGDTKLRHIEWVDHDNLMIETSLTTSAWGFKGEWFLLRVYNVPRNELRTLPGDTLGSKNEVMLPVILGFGPKTDTVLIESVEKGDRVWSLLSVNDKKLSAMPEEEVFDRPLRDSFTDRMIGGVRLVDLPQYEFFDPAVNRSWGAIVKAFDGDEVRYVSASRDFSKVVVLVQGPKYGYRYLLIDLVHPAAIPIGDVYAGIDKPHEVRPITYAAGDGLRIHAYLTLPERPAHDLPLVVLPHGGPAARDTAEFNWWSQSLADQGYAVLQANYRGSDVNEHLLEAGYGQWGRKMQTDLSDGVSYLVQQHIVDPGKACIVGASYGGYAALAGVTLQPTMYRCAVSVAGISDLARMLQWENRGGVDAREIDRYWDRYWGVSGPTDPALDTISPIKHVDDVKAPVLLIHGRDDTVVPFEQSQIMFDALRSHGKEVQLVTLKHEDHWLSHGETRLQMLQATVAFLRDHDPPN